MKISKKKFAEIKGDPQLADLREKINKKFGYKWEELEYDACEIPLVSAIAANLYLVQKARKEKQKIPDKNDVKKQSLFWAEMCIDDYNDNNENHQKILVKIEKGIKKQTTDTVPARPVLKRHDSVSEAFQHDVQHIADIEGK